MIADHDAVISYKLEQVLSMNIYPQKASRN